MTEANANIIKGLYEAFGRGDVDHILANVTNDCLWDFNGGVPEIVPWHAPAAGQEGVKKFIEAFVDNIVLSQFEPTSFIHSGDDVVVQIRIAYTVKRTQREVKQEQLHRWQVNKDGKVTRLCHFEDTRQVVAACS